MKLLGINIMAHSHHYHIIVNTKETEIRLSADEWITCPTFEEGVNIVSEIDKGNYCMVVHPNNTRDSATIDLSLWEDRLHWIPNIVVEFDSGNPRKVTGQVTGFEHYPCLKKMHMHALLLTNIGMPRDVDNTTTNLMGIEFCTELEHLSIAGHAVSDLSPITGLPLKELDICGNPISSFDPINFKTLRVFHIDSSHLDLFTDFHDLSRLGALYVYDHPAQDIATHPWIKNITEICGLRLHGRYQNHWGGASFMR